ncbi:hypothetical protein [Hyalangium sp.]|uniref:hypothetical protein n=1 Tax=Hyalangium sp. TaxID=2028555 RepID=UPI002D5B3A58|nr:hypothetical protein [Hyalangium sp.]HYI01364.1 hypothetical protein [Hyalangium sp.]
MRYLAVLLLLLALPALAAPPRYLYEEQDLTESAPTLSTDGMSLTSDGGYPVRGFMVSVCAGSGQTLTGGSSGGRLRAWVYHPDAALWMRNPDLDLSVTATVRCQAWPDLRAGYLQSRRVLFAADSILVSGGTTVTVRIDGDTSL